MNLNRSVRETRRRRVFREDSARFENQIWDKKSLIIGVGDMGNSVRWAVNVWNGRIQVLRLETRVGENHGLVYFEYSVG